MRQTYLELLNAKILLSLLLFLSLLFLFPFSRCVKFESATTVVHKNMELDFIDLRSDNWMQFAIGHNVLLH